MTNNKTTTRTKAEKLLAKALRSKKIHFLQNIRIEGYELDFLLPKFGIAIEVDGFFHLSTKQQNLDRLKEHLLLEKGLTLFRISNEQIAKDPNASLYSVAEFIKLLSSYSNSSSINIDWKLTLSKLSCTQGEPSAKAKKPQTLEDYFLSLDQE